MNVGTRWRALVVISLMAILAVPGPAGAQEGGYTGTYCGAATGSGGDTVPITLFVTDEGADMVITMSAAGFTVRIAAPEQWNGESAVTVAPTVPAIYSSVLSGSGSATFAGDGQAWKADGSGSGAIFVTKQGDASGAAQMISPGIDVDGAIAWHQANPVPGAVAPEPRPALVSQAEKLAAAAAPPGQAPLPDAERLLALAGVGLMGVVLLALAGVGGGSAKAAAAALAAAGTQSAIDSAAAGGEPR